MRPYVSLLHLLVVVAILLTSVPWAAAAPQARPLAVIEASADFPEPRPVRPFAAETYSPVFDSPLPTPE
ncbi:MAG: hypothetical protein K8R89_03575, partial [Anaerolineae bacterium]|nr:hypothetical protein [Anaerolineae bacterium]